MEMITEAREMQATSEKLRQQGKRIGFVPTMGALHQGHLSLIKRARRENDVVIVSIFVNPIQFGEGEDYEEYPRDLEADSKLVREAGVDAIFAPAAREMYPIKHITIVSVEGLSKRLCGASRSGHFRGVTTVVAKLFNITRPHTAYFGQKDYQQAQIIRRMVSDLSLDLKIEICPIVRERDGLAMSSRNRYLSVKERQAALVLFNALQKAKSMLQSGEVEAERIKEEIVSLIEREPLVTIDYVEVVNAESLEPGDEIEKETLVALAVRIGKTRLIDNLLYEPGEVIKCSG
ncbi:pantoate--beta-alanine ligase [bacterium]|nr:pantoate--beta-alanine ligase [bacterium]